MPNFWAGLSCAAQDLLSVHSAHPAQVHYLACIRRWILIQMAIALHFEHQIDQTRPQLSPKTLLGAIDGTGIACRNTVQAFLREMVRVQLTDQPSRETIRQRSPRVSEKCERLMLVYLGINLHALDLIDHGSRSATLARSPGLLAYLQPNFARRTCLSRAWYDPPTEVRCFTHCTSGSSILHSLVLATQDRRPDGDGRIWIGTVSAADLSQRYKVSAAHVARMLNSAGSLGAIGWTGPGRRGNGWLSTRLTGSYLLWQAEKLAALSIAFQEARTAFKVARRI